MLRVGGDPNRPHEDLVNLDVTSVWHYEPFPGQLPAQSITVLTVGGDEVSWRFQVRAYFDPAAYGAEHVAEHAEDIASVIEDLLTTRVGEFSWEFGFNDSLNLFVAALSCSVGREDFWTGD
jgi:hypothetical protein